MHYFRVNLDWLMDLTPEAAVFYSVCYNSYNSKDRRFIRTDENGEVYSRLPNNYFETFYKDKITAYKIKTYLDELEKAGYISILRVRKPNTQVRFIKCNVVGDYGSSIYIGADYMSCSVWSNYGIGLYMQAKSSEEEIDFNEYQDCFSEDEYNKIVRDMVLNKLLTEDYEPTELLESIYEEYYDYWQGHRKIKDVK